jgi:diaminopimelate epimerase
MRAVAFEKFEGLGNDFILVEAPASSLSRAEVKDLCDRHRGVGADGVLFVQHGVGHPSMAVVNADGSDAEMCGNGLRCVALFLALRGRVTARDFTIDTGAGPHAVRVLQAGVEGRVEVSMRPASLAPEAVPCLAVSALRDAPLDVQGHRLRVTAVSMGNPHAVTFDALEATTRAALGPALEAHASFPARANAGFASMRGPASIELHVFERGAGWTQACGTGACAAAVAAVETDRAPRFAPIEVVLPGGALEIVVGLPGDPVRMTGPARAVFRGVVELG